MAREALTATFKLRRKLDADDYKELSNQFAKLLYKVSGPVDTCNVQPGTNGDRILVVARFQNDSIDIGSLGKLADLLGVTADLRMASGTIYFHEVPIENLNIETTWVK
jgi:hypothetical protein